MNERTKQALERLDIDIDERELKSRAQRSVFFDERLAAAKSIGAINENSSDVELLGALAILDLMLEPPWSAAPQLKILKKLCSIDRDMCDYYRLSKKKNNWTGARFAKKHKLFSSTEQLKQFLSKLLEDDKTFNYISKNASSDSAALVDGFYALLGHFVEPNYENFNTDRYYALKRVFDLLYDTDYVFGPKHEKALLFLINNGGVSSSKLSSLKEQFPELTWLNPAKDVKPELTNTQKDMLKGIPVDVVMEDAKLQLSKQYNLQAKDIQVVLIGADLKPDGTYEATLEGVSPAKVKGKRVQVKYGKKEMKAAKKQAQAAVAKPVKKEPTETPKAAASPKSATWKYTQSPLGALSAFANPTQFRAAYEDLIVQKHPIALKMKAGKSFRDLLQAKDKDAQELFDITVKYIKDTIDPAQRAINAKDAGLVKAIGNMLKESNQKKTSKSKLDSLILKEYRDLLKEQEKEPAISISGEISDENEKAMASLKKRQKELTATPDKEAKKELDSLLDADADTAEKVAKVQDKAMSDIEKYLDSTIGVSAARESLTYTEISGIVLATVLSGLLARHMGKKSIRYASQRLILPRKTIYNRLGRFASAGQKIGGFGKKVATGTSAATKGFAYLTANLPGFFAVKALEKFLKAITNTLSPLMIQNLKLIAGKHPIQKFGSVVGKLESTNLKTNNKIQDIIDSLRSTDPVGNRTVIDTLENLKTALGSTQRTILDARKTVLQKINKTAEDWTQGMPVDADPGDLKEYFKTLPEKMQQTVVDGVQAASVIKNKQDEIIQLIDDTISNLSSQSGVGRNVAKELSRLKSTAVESKNAADKMLNFYKTRGTKGLDGLTGTAQRNEILRIAKGNRIFFGYMAKSAGRTRPESIKQLAKTLSQLESATKKFIAGQVDLRETLIKIAKKALGITTASGAFLFGEKVAEFFEGFGVTAYRDAMEKVQEISLDILIGVPLEVTKYLRPEYKREIEKGMENTIKPILFKFLQFGLKETVGAVNEALSGRILRATLDNPKSLKIIENGIFEAYKITFISNMLSSNKQEQTNIFLENFAAAFENIATDGDGKLDTEGLKRFCQILAKEKIRAKQEVDKLFNEINTKSMMAFLDKSYLVDDKTLDVTKPMEAAGKGIQELVNLSFLETDKKEEVNNQMQNLFFSRNLMPALKRLKYKEGYDSDIAEIKRKINAFTGSGKSSDLQDLLQSLPFPADKEIVQGLEKGAKFLKKYKKGSPIDTDETVYGDVDTYDFLVHLLCDIYEKGDNDAYPFMNIHKYGNKSLSELYEGDSLADIMIRFRNEELLRDELISRIDFLVKSKEYSENQLKLKAKLKERTDKEFDKAFDYCRGK